MNILTVNQLVKFVEDDHIERVLWVKIEQPGYILIDISSMRALPLYRRHAELEYLADIGQLAFDAEDPFPLPIDEDAIAPQHRALRDKNWERIAPLLAKQPDVLDRYRRGKIIAALVKELGDNHVALYRLLRRYWQRGMARNALLPDYAKCGGYGKDKTASFKPRGRRPDDPELASVNISPAIRKLFRTSITAYYARKEVFDMSECFHLMLRMHFTDSVIDPTEPRIIW
jgi:hypothetical protein